MGNNSYRTKGAIKLGFMALSIAFTFVLDGVLQDVLGYIAESMNQQSVREFSHSSRVSGIASDL